MNIEQELLPRRRSYLLDIIKQSYDSSQPHSCGFAQRVMNEYYKIDAFILSDISTLVNGLVYEGYPQIANIGFLTNANLIAIGAQFFPTYIASLNRLMQRSDNGIKPFLTDDIAILGIALGLVTTRKLCSEPDFNQICDWLIEIIDTPPKTKLWTYRMRELAGDILDGRGRLKVTLSKASYNSNVLEIVLRELWSDQFVHTAGFTNEEQHQILKYFLTEPLPQFGDLELAVVWLRAIDILVGQSCTRLLPTISDVSRILHNIQHALKRWPWEVSSTRKDVAPARWLIDKESHVQSLLWTILYPFYGAELVDETYLPNWGNAQPRFDLGIRNLKLIIEVKYARTASDFTDIEGQIGEDLGLYFKDLEIFNHMVVFIYDDCDHPVPEKYDGLRNALMKRDRIADVIIIQRPSMIPSRKQRGP